MGRPLGYSDWVRRHDEGAVPSGAWFLCGPESLLRDHILSLIKSRMFEGEEQARLGHDRFYGGEGSLTAVTSALASVGLFSGSRLVTLSEPERFGRSAGAERKELLRFLDGGLTGSVFVAASDLSPWELDRKNEFTKALLTSCQVVDLGHPTPAEALRWLLAECRRRSLKLEADGGEYLMGRVGPDLQELSRELEKLELSTEPGQAIGRETLQDLIHRGQLGTGFEFVEAVLAGRAGEALRLWSGLSRSEPVLRLQWQIQRRGRDRLSRSLHPKEEERMGKLLLLAYGLERSIKQGRIPSGQDGTALEMLAASVQRGGSASRTN